MKRFIINGPKSRTKQTQRPGPPTSVVDPNTLNLDPDPGFWPNLDPDPGPDLDPGYNKF